jgi:hypothetical protein
MVSVYNEGWRRSLWGRWGPEQCDGVDDYDEFDEDTFFIANMVLTRVQAKPKGSEWSDVVITSRTEPDKYGSSELIDAIRGGCIYLSTTEGNTPLSVDPLTDWVELSGPSSTGKHSLSEVLERRLATSHGSRSVLIEQQLTSGHVAGIKRQARERLGMGFGATENTILSGLGLVEMVRRIKAEGVKMVYNWRGGMGAFVQAMLATGYEEIGEFIKEYQGLEDALWHEEGFGGIMEKYGKALEDIWGLMATIVNKRNEEDRWVRELWPLIKIPFGVIAISNLSPAKAYEMRNKRSQFRGSDRAHGNRLTEVDYATKIRLIEAAMLAKFPDFIFAFGGFRDDYEVGGVEIIAREVLEKSSVMISEMRQESGLKSNRVSFY